MQNIPFVPKAQEYIALKGFTLKDLDKEYFKPILKKAYQRIRSAIMRGIVEGEINDIDVEILSYSVAIAILAYINDKRLSMRFAIAEARRVGAELKKESDTKLLEIAKSLSWDVRKIEHIVGNELYTFAIHFCDYLSVPPPNDPYWKLVNRALVNGYVLIRKQELARLIEEYVRHYVYNKVVSVGKFNPPEALINVVKEITKLWSRRQPKGEEGISGKGGRFPPCMRVLLESLKNGENLSHMERFALTTFLINIGYEIDDIIELFRRVPDFNEKITRYQVEHLAGLRGSKKRYLPPSCRTMKTFNLCPGGDDLCRKIRNPLSYYKLSSRRKMRNEK